MRETSLSNPFKVPGAGADDGEDPPARHPQQISELKLDGAGVSPASKADSTGVFQAQVKNDSDSFPDGDRPHSPDLEA